MRAARRANSLVATAVATSLLGAGCGTVSVPSLNSVANDCLQHAREISQPDARKVAEDACSAAKTGNVGKVESAARQACLKAVNAIPDSREKEKVAARSRCEAIK